MIWLIKIKFIKYVHIISGGTKIQGNKKLTFVVNLLDASYKWSFYQEIHINWQKMIVFLPKNILFYMPLWYLHNMTNMSEKAI